MDRRRRVWLTQRPDRPNLIAEWIDDAGNRRAKSTGTSDLTRAENIASDIEYRLNNGLLIHGHGEPLTWAEFREKFNQEYICHLRPRTREKFDTVFDVFEDLAKPKRLSDCNDRLISQFAASMRDGDYEAISIKNYLIAVKTSLRWATKQKLLPAVPEFPSIKVAKTKPPQVPTEIVERLFALAPDDQWRALLGFAWWAGLRISEVLSLRWESTDTHPYLDLRVGRIVFPATSQKNGQDQWVPIHSELREMIDALPVDGDSVLSLRSRDGNLMTRPAVSSVVGRMARQAGVKLSMHKLRKGFGSRIAKARGKAGAAILHRLMRHSSMQVTMDYYANVDDAISDAIEEI